MNSKAVNMERGTKIYLQVQWIEEENHVFAFVLSEIDFLELTVYHSGTGEVWCWFIKCWHFRIFCLLFKEKNKIKGKIEKKYSTAIVVRRMNDDTQNTDRCV